MSALFRAYRRITNTIDIDRIARSLGDGKQDRCGRCGTCCATLNPGPMPSVRYREWRSAENPLGGFLKVVARPSANEAWYAGWFMDDIRLRMCPLLFYCTENDAHFCAVYHYGSGQRPEACETFRPNPPHCAVSQRPLVP